MERERVLGHHIRTCRGRVLHLEKVGDHCTGLAVNLVWFNDPSTEVNLWEIMEYRTYMLCTRKQLDLGVPLSMFYM